MVFRFAQLYIGLLLFRVCVMHVAASVASLHIPLCRIVLAWRTVAVYEKMPIGHCEIDSQLCARTMDCGELSWAGCGGV